MALGGAVHTVSLCFMTNDVLCMLRETKRNDLRCTWLIDIGKGVLR